MAGSRIGLDEAGARRVILVQAIETADAQGKLLSQTERDQIERQALAALRQRTDPGRIVAIPLFLEHRARAVLEQVGLRHPELAGLVQARSGQRWLAAAVPVATLVLGAATDRIANPHRLNLLAPELLAIMAWNVGIYLMLIVAGLLPRWPATPGTLTVLQRWTVALPDWRGPTGRLRASVRARFHALWFEATAARQAGQWKRTLHLAAAGWGAGAALSLILSGVVARYRVGWESTFLDAAQVQTVLNALFLPATQLLGLPPFTLEEVRSLDFDIGASQAGGLRWVLLYVSLLLLVVVLPRCLLAAVSLWRDRRLSRHVWLDLDQPYFQPLVGLVSPATVQLGLYAEPGQDLAHLLRLLPGEVLRTDHGDELRLHVVPRADPAAAHPAARNWVSAWLSRLWRIGGGRRSAPEAGRVLQASGGGLAEPDLILHLVGKADAADAAPFRLDGKPVLVLVNSDGPPSQVNSQGQHPRQAQAQASRQDRCWQRQSGDELPAVLGFDAFAHCWVQEPVLMDAIACHLPVSKRPGFERLAKAWQQRNLDRFSQSMAALTAQLLYAAAQMEPVDSTRLSVKTLLNPAERQANSNARSVAMAAVIERLDRSAAATHLQLQQLHGLAQAAAAQLEQRLERNFVVQESVDTPQAGLAGAATGAAMGVSLDLLVGGLTLGAATALGALAGGSAALIAAAWKNRATPGGASVLQLSDEMMLAMVVASLLRYLAVAHFGRGPDGALADPLRPFWKTQVMAAVETRKERLAELWAAARKAQDAPALTTRLAHELEAIAHAVLANLYPGHNARVNLARTVDPSG